MNTFIVVLIFLVVYCVTILLFIYIGNNKNNIIRNITLDNELLHKNVSEALATLEKVVAENKGLLSSYNTLKESYNQLIIINDEQSKHNENAKIEKDRMQEAHYNLYGCLLKSKHHQKIVSHCGNSISGMKAKDVYRKCSGWKIVLEGFDAHIAGYTSNNGVIVGLYQSTKIPYAIQENDVISKRDYVMYTVMNVEDIIFW
jgi:hypothetical protein